MIQHTIEILRIVAILGCISSSFFYLLCLLGVRVFLGSQKTSAALPNHIPLVSILKPLKGIDPDIDESFRSHCRQDYPEYEIIFGVSDPEDPAVASVQRLKQEFPRHSIQLIVCPNILGPNVKVSNLEQ